MTDLIFNPKNLENVTSVEIRYTGIDKEIHNVRSEIKFISENKMTLFFLFEKDFNLNCSEVTIKYVVENALYCAEVEVDLARKVGELIYLTIFFPKHVKQVSQRKYYRINLKRACVLIATDKRGNSTAYMSRVVDVSAGGILIHKLESMFNSDYLSINPSDYERFNIVLFLDLDIVLKLSARCVRKEKGETSSRYAFEFTKIKQSDIDTICKYVTKEQVEQIKMQKKLRT